MNQTCIWFSVHGFLWYLSCCTWETGGLWCWGRYSDFKRFPCLKCFLQSSDFSSFTSSFLFLVRPVLSRTHPSFMQEHRQVSAFLLQEGWQSNWFSLCLSPIEIQEILWPAHPWRDHSLQAWQPKCKNPRWSLAEMQLSLQKDHRCCFHRMLLRQGRDWGTQDLPETSIWTARLIWWWKQQHNQPKRRSHEQLEKDSKHPSFLPSSKSTKNFYICSWGSSQDFYCRSLTTIPEIVAESTNRCCKERPLTKRWPSRKTWTKQGDVLQATHNNGVSEPSAAALSNDDGVVGPDGTRTSCIHSRAIPVASILAMLQSWKRTCSWTSKREREEHQIRVRVSFSFFVFSFFFYFLHSFVFHFPRVLGTTKLPFLWDIWKSS